MDNNAGIHPAPVEFSPAEIAQDQLLHFFHYAHLPPKLQATSAAFAGLARTIVNTIPRNAERTVALRKLLEARDCAVRANLPAPSFEKREPVEAEPELGEPVEVGDAEISRDGGPRFQD